VVFVLNHYLGQMSDAISDAGGYVDKFLGDGIMAIIGMEKTLPQGARDTLAAAKAIDIVLSLINESLAADLDKPLNIGIGIHTGPAILGRIGVKGGSGSAQRITALGDMV
jgi:adenylate cyclase